MGMTLSKAKKLVAKHGTVAAAARAASVPRTTLSSILKRTKKGVAPTTNRKVGLSRKEFMSEYDPATKTKLVLRKVISEHLEDDRYISDYELRKLAGIGDPRMWRDIANDPDEDFTKYQFEACGKRWWTTPKSRDEIVTSSSKMKAV